MSRFEMNPAYAISQLEKGYAALAKALGSKGVWLLEGAAAADWDALRAGLDAALADLKVKVEWLDARQALLSLEERWAVLRPTLGIGDLEHGRLFDGELKSLFREEKLKALVAKAENTNDLCVVFGPGSSLLPLFSAKIGFVELTNEQEIALVAAGKAHSLVGVEPASMRHVASVDWQVMDHLAGELLTKVDLYVNLDDPTDPVAATGMALRAAAKTLRRQPFCAAPTLRPARWGGHYLNKVLGLENPPDTIGQMYLLHTRKNAVILRSKNAELRFPFTRLLNLEPAGILGEVGVRAAGEKLPVHFNLVDTVGSASQLPIQVHPNWEQAWRDYNATASEDESYYILHSEGGNVNLGLRSDVDPQKFVEALRLAREEAVNFNQPDYVDLYPTRAHDAIHVPAGVVHDVGPGNVLLEVSLAHDAHIYRLFDYLQRFPDGRLRPVQVEEGLRYLDWDGNTDFVRQNSFQPARLLSQNADATVYVVMDTAWYGFEMQRIELQGTHADDTQGRSFHAIMLIEGEGVSIEGEGFKQPLHTYELALVPADCGAYRLVNQDKHGCKVLKTFMK